MEIFAKNTILVNFLTVLILVGGFISVYSIQKEARPPVDLDVVTVTTLTTWTLVNKVVVQSNSTQKR